MKDEEKDILNDENFNNLINGFEKNKLKKAVRIAKWKSIFRNLIISSLVFIILGSGCLFVSWGINDRQRHNIENATSTFFDIARPNKYMGKITRYDGNFGGKSIYTTYKLIEGKLVYTGEGSYTYGLAYDLDTDISSTSSPLILGETYDEEFLKLNRFNELGQREMIFFYPYVDYKMYKNDLSLLDEIGEDKYMEMAISFDKEYSIEEVNKMLPPDVNLTWYWVDEVSKEEKEKKKAHDKIQSHSDGEKYTMHYPGEIRSEERAYGVKVYDENGEKLDNPVEYFISNLESGLNDRSIYKNEFTSVYNVIAGEDGKLTKEDIKVQGIVVTGNRENIKCLKDLSFIKASSLGVVTDKY